MFSENWQEAEGEQIKKYRKFSIHTQIELMVCCKKLKKTKETNLKEFRRVLMGLEGFSAKLYFEALVRVIPKSFRYEGMRTRRPPKDLFNAAISFGYAYLKCIVDRSLILKSINPYYGILHHEEDKVLPLLTFYIMEGFRHSLIDKAVINLISRKKLKLERHGRVFKSGVYINKIGVKILYKELSQKLGATGKELDREIFIFLKLCPLKILKKIFFGRSALVPEEEAVYSRTDHVKVRR